VAKAASVAGVDEAEVQVVLARPQIAAELAKRTSSVAGRATKGATLGIVAEAPTEVLEQAAERWQAGLSLTDDEAKKEYKEASPQIRYKGVWYVLDKDADITALINSAEALGKEKFKAECVKAISKLRGISITTYPYVYINKQRAIDVIKELK
jgi:uncharacterized protein YchJ